MKNYTFTEWFDMLGVRNFRADEFTEYFQTRRRGVTNHAPPPEMWANIVPTLKIVDRLREHFGRPIVILSSYRSPAYNAAIGDAAPKSYHMRFQALDISVAGRTPSQVFYVLKGWRAAGRFSGGLGLYNTFVHVDTRGHDATWGE